jgi:tRNA modification GTPase
LEDNDVVITNARHYEALVHAQTALYRTLNSLYTGTSGDFLAQDIREAIHHLEGITGAISSDEILGNIFSHFCIGK